MLRAFSLAMPSAGNSMAASTEMMAMTTSNSMRVKPVCVPPAERAGPLSERPDHRLAVWNRILNPFPCLTKHFMPGTEQKEDSRKHANDKWQLLCYALRTSMRYLNSRYAC